HHEILQGYKKDAWRKEIPYDIRDDGYRDFEKARKNARAKKGKSKFKFRSRKHDPTHTFTVRHRDLTAADDLRSVQFHKRFFWRLGAHETMIKTAEPVPAVRDH